MTARRWLTATVSVLAAALVLGACGSSGGSSSSTPASPSTGAMSRYTAFVSFSTDSLLRSTRAFCFAVKAGDRSLAQQRYAQARVFYEQIEPVAEVFGDLDTQIDGRWQNPVTKKSQFMGFHRLEQILWDEPSLTGATALCQGLMDHEEKLVALVSKARYSPQEMAAGATDLINEAATSKITGEEERYSHTDLVDFDANMKASMKVAGLLSPVPADRRPGPGQPDPAAQRRGAAAAHQVPGPAGLRAHRLRQLHRRDQGGAAAAVRRGERLRRGAVRDAGQGQLIS